MTPTKPVAEIVAELDALFKKDGPGGPDENTRFSLCAKYNWPALRAELTRLSEENKQLRNRLVKDDMILGRDYEDGSYA